MIVVITHPVKSKEYGWRFVDNDEEMPPCKPDILNHKYVSEYYFDSDPSYSGICSVPFLFDLHTKKIVNNNSDDIVNMFNKLSPLFDYIPKALLPQIEQMNAFVDTFRSYVFKAGMAKTQQRYDENAGLAYYSLDILNMILSTSPYLNGNELTKSDLLLFPTIVRFDVGYACAFHLNLRSIKNSYPFITNWAIRIYNLAPQTVNMEHIKLFIFDKDLGWNNSGIIPLGIGIQEEFDNQIKEIFEIPKNAKKSSKVQAIMKQYYRNNTLVYMLILLVIVLLFK